ERGRGEHVGKFPHPLSSNGWLYPAAKGGRLLAATILAADLSPNCIQQSAGLALRPGVSQRLTTCNSTVQVQCSGAATQSSSSSFSSSIAPFTMTRTRTRNSRGRRRFGQIRIARFRPLRCERHAIELLRRRVAQGLCFEVIKRARAIVKFQLRSGDPRIGVEGGPVIQRETL